VLAAFGPKRKSVTVLAGFILLGLGARLFWLLLPNASAERNRQAAAVNCQPGGGDHGEVAETATRQMDKPSTESDDGCAPRNCEDRPEGATSCLERRSQDESETQERIGQACDNQVAGGENMNLGN